jgi:hypothetical protein
MIHRRAHPLFTPRRPQGQPTRGKTARNRLRRVDTFLLGYDPALIRRQDGDFAGALFVDLGYGAEPFTTLESAARLRRVNPRLPVLGVEIDPERVAAAQPFADEQTHFRLGGFNLPLRVDPDGRPEQVRVIRAFNVLRQYQEAEVAEAYTLMARGVLPGGLLVEGTADPLGRVWVANVLRRTAASITSAGEPASHSGVWQAEALVLSTNFRTGFDPAAFQAVLPKNLIHRMAPGEPIYDFFQAWKQATLETAAFRGWGARQWFVASAGRLAASGYRIDLHGRWLRRGFLVWRLS